MTDEWSQRARSFGQVAGDYDRWRPGYPDQLIDDVLALAPNRPVLEAGAGTGRATLALASRGASVLAVEPDPEMAAVARRRVDGLDVTVEEGAFEDHVGGNGTFGLVVSAQAWHWVDPVRGATVAARALGHDGALCLWWNRPGALGGPVWDAVHRAYADHAPNLDRREALSTQTWREETMDPAPGFGPWALRHYEWSETYGPDQYANLVATHSDHLLLPAGERDQLLDGIRDAIAGAGGMLEYRYRTVLTVARPA